MHLWKFITSVPDYQKGMVLNLGRVTRFPALLMIMSQFDGEERADAIVDFEKDIRELIKDAYTRKDAPTLVFAYEALGRIFFTRGLFVAAAAQFEEAIKYLKKLRRNKKLGGRDYKLLLSKLLSWLALSYLNLGEFRKAVKAFDKAIKLLDSIAHGEPIIGELHSLKGDAISFIDPEEAVNEIEIAHEILMKHPSIVLITNAVKLFVALAVRNYKNDAVDILYEAFDKLFLPEVMEDLSLVFYRNFVKLLNKLYFKIVGIIDWDSLNDQAIKKFMLGVEGIKGVYFIFRYFLKPVLPSRHIIDVNKTIAIVNQLKIGGIRLLDEIIQKKEMMMDRIERAYFLKFRDSRIHFPIIRAYSIYDRMVESMISNFSKNFRRVAFLSFERTGEEGKFLMFFHELSSGKSYFRKVEITSDNIKELLDEKSWFETSEKVISLLKLERIIPSLSEFEDKDLVLVSPTSYLHQVPFEAIFLNSGKMLGISTNLIRVPTLYIIPIWTLLHTRRWGGIRKKRIVLNIGTQTEQKELVKIINKLKKGTGIKVISEYTMLKTNFVSIYHIKPAGFSISIDGVYINAGDRVLNPLDVEKLDLEYNILILETPRAVEVQEFKYGSINFATAFLAAGAKSVVTLGKAIPREAIMDFFSSFYERVLKYKETVAAAVLAARRVVSQRNLDNAPFFYVYGNPLVRV